MNILIKIFFIFKIYILSNLFAVSAPPFIFEVGQPDGTKIPIKMFGDEYYNWMETEDGYVIDYVDDGMLFGWYYSNLNSNGKYYSTNIYVEYPAPKNLNISKKLRETFPRYRNIQHFPLINNNSQNRVIYRSQGISILKPLILLADFNDLPTGLLSRKWSKEAFKHLFFDINLNPENIFLPNDPDFPSTYTMSVRDYYYEISNGSLEIFGDSESIVDWIVADYSYSYYVDGVQGTGNGNGPDATNNPLKSAAALIMELLLKIDLNVDFTNFDGDGDGIVDMVILIVEGWGNGTDGQFWPHMSVISSQLVNEGMDSNNNGFADFDGIDVVKYLVINEQYYRDYSGAEEHDIHPIGTICHEIGHVLGLPDLYDTSHNSSSAAGIGEWGLMGSGNWLKETSPAYMSAWSRYRLGFIEPFVIDNVYDSEEVFLLPAALSGKEYTAMILPIDSNMPQEYLIIENRQKRGSDKYLKESGLLVWHIDETIADMYPAMKDINVDNRFYGVNLIQADAKGDLYTPSGNADASDPFPGSLGIVELTTSSYPDLSTYSYDRDADGIVEFGNNSQVQIKNIKEEIDSIITFEITNPNFQGEILKYDLGGPNAITNFTEDVWVGNLFNTTKDSLILSGIMAFLPSSQNNQVNSYSLRIYSSWDNNKPSQIIYSVNNQNVNWNLENGRKGGWVYIPLINEHIFLLNDNNYYVEFMYEGTGLLYSYDNSEYTGKQNNVHSYVRLNEDNSTCLQLTEVGGIIGNWNIRLVISGYESLSLLSIHIPQIPKKHRIFSNYPNPFNASTIVPIYLARPANITYKIFDLRGNNVKQKDYSALSAGYHELMINIDFLSSGVYFYQFNIDGVNFTNQKMVLLK